MNSTWTLVHLPVLGYRFPTSLFIQFANPFCQRWTAIYKVSKRLQIPFQATHSTKITSSKNLATCTTRMIGKRSIHNTHSTGSKTRVEGRSKVTWVSDHQLGRHIRSAHMNCSSLTTWKSTSEAGMLASKGRNGRTQKPASILRSTTWHHYPLATPSQRLHQVHPDSQLHRGPRSSWRCLPPSSFVYQGFQHHFRCNSSKWPNQHK
mmetsp:Transcript_3647/g.6429  ORF Transcript_3647/g.6429 Transcript_3647/m.6429 type:complete len:206 (+) Transcript_3647:201-818(+)